MIKPPLLIFPIFFAVTPGCATDVADSAWKLTGHADGFRIDGVVYEDRDVSAMSLSPDGVGVLASDEGGTIQTLERTRDGVRIVATEALDPRNAETDFEGAAFLDGRFYVTGSHGVSKKKGEVQESRYRLYRFRVGEGGRTVEGLERASIAEILANDEVLAPHVHQPLQRRGLNIEGLAARDGHLFFGLRSPNLDGDAIIVEVDPDALFGSGTTEAVRHHVGLARGLGIRSLATTRDGFLIIAGNAGSEASDAFPQPLDHADGTGFHFFHWTPGEPAAERIGPVPDGGGKAEGLEVLAESDGRIDFVVLFDSPRGGAPRRLVLEHKPSAATTTTSP